ncbi:MAG: PrsW family intramembrane metalloprotease [Propionibacteriaceae bacterium]|nr:PrsW family intramembrane metalloprotease [Propionibacteriaceae bacterium]
MDCSRCHSQVPDVAHFCHRCGLDLLPDSERGKRHFAVKPDEPIASFAVVSSIMPREAGRHPQTYRMAFTITLAAALVAAVFGALPIAVLIAAFAIPLVYIVYLYDVNMWEDEPIAVVGLGFLLTFGLGVLFTWLWTGWLPIQTSLPDPEGGLISGPNWGAFLIFALLVPIVGEAIRQVGPVLLASRPAFDDLMDGVTFGVISGVAYAAADTLVRHWALITGGMANPDPGQWATLVLLEGFVKPLVMGTASGLAAAEFSGLGKGYDGFTPRYYSGVALAVGVNILYAVGVYLLGFVGNASLAVALQLVWGILLLGLLILRLRSVLHIGLTEAALEAAATSGSYSEGGTGEQEFCAQCELPLMNGALFCSACGASTRARPRVPVAAGVSAASGTAEATAPPPDPTPASSPPVEAEAEAEATTPIEAEPKEDEK